MVRVHIWLRKKDGLSAEEFRDYWLTKHAPIAGGGYEHLQGYEVDLVTRVPEGQEAPYDGVAILTWEDRDGTGLSGGTSRPGRGGCPWAWAGPARRNDDKAITRIT